MYFAEKDISFQSIPGEISLVYLISGCPLRCKDCHSKYAFNPLYGEQFTLEKITEDLNKYKNLISVICFYGGEWEHDNLLRTIRYIKRKIPLKIGLFTGLNLDEVNKELLKELDYIKVGRFKTELGGLREKTTNQKLYKIKGEEFEDITNLFWK